MYNVTKHKPKSKPAQLIVAKELSLHGVSNKQIAIALNADIRSICGSISVNKEKKSTRHTGVNILSKALLSRPMSEWGFVYRGLRG